MGDPLDVTWAEDREEGALVEDPDALDDVEEALAGPRGLLDIEEVVDTLENFPSIFVCLQVLLGDRAADGVGSLGVGQKEEDAPGNVQAAAASAELLEEHLFFGEP